MVRLSLGANAAAGALSSGMALDLNRLEIGVRRLGCERKRGLQRFKIGCAVWLPAAGAGIVSFMRRCDLEIEQADRCRREAQCGHRRELRRLHDAAKRHPD